MGSLLTTWVTFAPYCFFIFAGAPFIERLQGNVALSTALSAVTAAVVGAVLNLAVWFAVFQAARHDVAPVETSVPPEVLSTGR